MTASDFHKSLVLVTSLAFFTVTFIVAHQRCCVFGRYSRVPPVKSSLLGVRVRREWAMDPVAFLENSSREYGGIFRIRTLFFTTFWLINKSLVKIYLDASEEVWSYGEALKLHLHNIAAPEYFTNFHIWASVAARGLIRSDAQIQHSTAAARETSLALRHWSQRSEVQLFSCVSYLVHRILVATLLGHDFYDNHLDEIYQLMIAIDNEANAKQESYLPTWASRPGNGQEARSKLDQLFQERLSRRDWRWGSKSGDMDHLSFAVQDPTTGQLSGHFATHFIVLWISIHGTMTSNIAWTLSELVKSPRRLQALRLDLDRSDPLQSPVLSAYLNETHRHYSPIYSLRLSQQQVSLSDHPNAPNNEISNLPDVPIGARVAMSPYFLHHDPSTWLLADSYYPERWLENPELERTLNEDGVTNYLPIVSGDGSKFGEEMSRRVSLIVIAYIVKSAEVEWGGEGDSQDTKTLDWRSWGAPWLKGDMRVKFRAK